MKAITFLGVTPREAIYTMEGKDCAANHFGIALAHFMPDLKLRALVTQKALDEQYPAFEQEVEDYVADVQAVPIPDGRDADELWRLFDCVIENIDEDEEVVFDITHAFRSLPFLSFLAAAYVRIVKRARLKGVYYANLMAASGDPSRVPVVDLTEFVSLLDWMIAADLFNRRGDGSRLADLMRRGLPNLALGQHNLQTSTASSGAITSMENVSKNLRLIRPDDVMKASTTLISCLQEIADPDAQIPRPFRPLLSQVADAYRPLVLAEPDKDPVAALAVERELVTWYLDRGYLVQATAVAREWLVTWALLQSGQGKIRKRYYREEMENAITGLLERFRNDPRPSIFDRSQLPQRDKLADLYDRLSKVRNDLLHAGKREKPLEGDRLEGNIRAYCSELADFPLPEPPQSTP